MHLEVLGQDEVVQFWSGTLSLPLSNVSCSLCTQQWLPSAVVSSITHVSSSLLSRMAVTVDRRHIASFHVATARLNTVHIRRFI